MLEDNVPPVCCDKVILYTLCVKLDLAVTSPPLNLKLLLVNVAPVIE